MDDFLRSLHGQPAMLIGLSLGALLYFVFFGSKRKSD